MSSLLVISNLGSGSIPLSTLPLGEMCDPKFLSSRNKSLAIVKSMRTGSTLKSNGGPLFVGKTGKWTPETMSKLTSLGRRGRGGPPRPRRNPQIATDPPHTSYRPLRPGERVDGGDEGSHGPYVAPGSRGPGRGCPAGCGRPSSPRRGR